MTYILRIYKDDDFINEIFDVSSMYCKDKTIKGFRRYHKNGTRRYHKNGTRRSLYINNNWYCNFKSIEQLEEFHTNVILKNCDLSKDQIVVLDLFIKNGYLYGWTNEFIFGGKENKNERCEN
jgi:hypothetical protein